MVGLDTVTFDLWQTLIVDSPRLGSPRMKARLERIGADTIVDETGEHFFEIRVRTEKNFLGTELAPLPIMTGMIASVDIITGEKTVLDYLLKPVKRATANAMRER